MAEQILIGDSLLEYMKDVEAIRKELQDAYGLAWDCHMNIMEAGTYQGKALESQQIFFCSLAEHLQRMILLYQASGAYLLNVYLTMHYTDEQLADYVIRILEDRGWKKK